MKAEVLAVLRSMYPNTTIPEPDAFYVPRWQSDPLYRGSYSNWPSSFLKTHHVNLRASVGQRLWFGGEATSLKYFGGSRSLDLTRARGRRSLTGASWNPALGYLHGAYYEGQKMAGEMARCVEDGGCDGLPHVEAILCSHRYIPSDFA